MAALSNVKHENFAQHIANGVADTKAYIKAGYKASSAQKNAARMKENEGIKARVAEIRAKTQEKLEFSRECLAKHLFAAATTPPDQIDASSPLCQEYIEELASGKASRRVKSMGKVESARLLCDMMGWKEPDKQELSLGQDTLESLKAQSENIGRVLGMAYKPKV